MPEEGSDNRFRALPGVDRVTAALADAGPQTAVTAATRQAVDDAREAIRAGHDAPSFEDVVAAARSLLEDESRKRLRRVVNATGVLVHTNLGRVPLGRRALDAVADAAEGYSNLEYDVVAGRRGSRHDHVARSLALLTGAEAALVVNNNAAAVLVALAALAAGREVVISRGELIEIGGEFRIPDVLSASGARLVEVGTTNRTHLADYERAITERTAVVLKVHPSNYRVVGFTAHVPARDLARLARGRKVWFVHDVGSGLVEPGGDAGWLGDEPVVERSVAEGADVVTFSGDKLLGGPQAGVIVGAAAALAKIAAHPLMRVVRPDKMTLAALGATIDTYMEGGGTELPLWKLALASPDDLAARAEAIAAAIRSRSEAQGAKAEAVPSSSVAGGGSLPGAELESWAVALTHPERTPDELARRLRLGRVPVVCRIDDDRVLLDVRTVLPGEDEIVVEMAADACGDSR